MGDLIGGIVGLMHFETGLFIDVDEVLDALDWIVTQPHEEQRQRVFELQRQIERVVGRMTRGSELRYIPVYVQELAR